jgi:hypothetical protein
MRQKTSFALEEDILATIRDHAHRSGVDMSTWVERAVRQQAAAMDLELYDEWKASWSAEDQAIEAALDAAERGTNPAT